MLPKFTLVAIALNFIHLLASTPLSAQVVFPPSWDRGSPRTIGGGSRLFDEGVFLYPRVFRVTNPDGERKFRQTIEFTICNDAEREVPFSMVSDNEFLHESTIPIGYCRLYQNIPNEYADSYLEMEESQDSCSPSPRYKLENEQVYYFGKLPDHEGIQFFQDTE